MNINSIKRRADELIAYCKPQYTRILLIMMIIGLIPSVFPSEGIAVILSFIVTVLFTPFNHGYIVTSLKIVRNNSMSLEDSDAWVGLTRFSELFFTYFLYELIIFAVAFVLCMIAFVIFFVGGVSLADMTSLNSALILMFVLIIVISVILVIINLYGFAYPYLLEQYGYTGMDAIKESFAFIKGHVKDLFKLEFSYMGWVLLVVLIQAGGGTLLSSLGTLGSVIAALAGGFVGIMTYTPQYHVAKAIFFEEIAYRRYQYNDDAYTQNDEVRGEDNVY